VHLLRRLDSKKRVTYTRSRINTIDYPDDEHSGAPNMKRNGINIHEKRIVRQDCYLQELNRDTGQQKIK
jgi:hypothetical protein